MKTKIITDSVSELSKSIAEMYDIEVIPVKISFGSGYSPVSEVDIAETIAWMEENKKRPEFRGVSSEDYAKAFEKYLAEGMEIVCIASDGASISNYDNACHASTLFPNARINVIDSHKMSANVGLLVLNAAKLAQKNESANAIAINIENNHNQFEGIGLLDSLDFLQYCGYCPRIMAAGSNLLHAKFMIKSYEDQNADVKIAGYSMSKAIVPYCKFALKDLYSISPERVFITHTLSDANYFSEVYNYINNLNYFDDIIVCESGHFNSTMTGRNCINISYQLKK